MTGQRLRVFVSSRMQELAREREAIRTALAELRIDTFLFEIDAGARPASVQQTYLDEVEDADLYVGVFWKGYGPHTMAEFEHACSLGMDCLIYEKRDDAAAARDAVLQTFLDRIGSAGDTGLVTIGRFDTIERLRESIKDDVARWQATLARQMRESQSAIVHGVPSRPLADFVGRGEGIARMVRALRSGRDLAIEGLPGIGKTTLAVVLAHHPGVRRFFKDGVLWAGLGPKGDPADALMRWAQALAGRSGVNVNPEKIASLPNLDDRAQKLRDAIGQRRMLFVIDDVWDGDAAEALRCGGPHCAHIITTRDKLIAQTFARSDNVERLLELDENDAHELVRRLAPEAYGARPEVVRTLVRTVGGLPQAVRLIGGYLAQPTAAMFGDVFGDLSSQAFEEMANPQKRLELAERRLGSRAAGKISIRETIELSLQGLPDSAQRTFYRLGAFAAKPERFTTEAAMAVAETDATTLARLAARNLLDVDTTTQRVSIHTTLADVARTQPDSSSVARHREHYLGVLSQASGNPRQIEDMYGQLRWAWHQCPDDDSLYAFFYALRPFQKRRGLFAERLAWAERARRVAETRDEPAVARGLLGAAAEAESILGHLEQALEHQRQALAIAESIRQPVAQIEARLGIALMLSRLGSRHEAMLEAERARTLAEGTGDPPNLLPVTLVAIALLQRAAQATASAIDTAERAAALFRELGQKYDEAVCLRLLGGLYRDAGNHERALEDVRASMELQAEFGDADAYAEAGLVMASVSDVLGQLEDALATAQDASAKAEASGNRQVVAQGLGVVGDLLLKLGRVDEALARYTQQLALFDEAENRAGRVRALTNIADAHRANNDAGGMLRAAEEALRGCRDLGDPLRLADTLELVAVACNRAKAPRRALSYLRQALTIRQQVDDQSAQAKLLGDMGCLFIMLGLYERAMDAYSRANALFADPLLHTFTSRSGPTRTDMRAHGDTRFGPRLAERSALIPPLMLAMGTALSLRLDEGNLRQTFLEATDARRLTIQQSLGVLPPRVVLTEYRLDIEQDTYQIIVSGVPLANVSTNKDDRIDDITSHLAAVIRKYLHLFVGHQQTLDMVERRAPERASTLRGEPMALSALVLLLRTLLEEVVPVVAFEDILESFLDAYAARAPRLEILQSARLLPRVRAHLPGNTEPGPCLQLPADAEEQLLNAIRVDDSGSYLAMGPELSQPILAVVKRAIALHEDAAAIVVIKPEVRRFARKLIDLEFPFIPVLSYEELLPERTGSVCDMAHGRN
jgi:tetratricopeptide (TPR) repeat protein